MRNQNKLLSIVLLVVIFIISCKKTSIRDSDFCTPIANQQYNNVGGFIDRFLQKQNNYLTSQQKLEELATWLKNYSCIKNVDILCNSCIKTLPEQSELKITFNVNGQPIIKVLDISMTSPLKFVTFHD